MSFNAVSRGRQTWDACDEDDLPSSYVLSHIQTILPIWRYARWVLMQQCSPLARVALLFEPHARLVAEIKTGFLQWWCFDFDILLQSIGHFPKLGWTLSRLVLVLVCFTYHGTLKWVIHITSSLEARFGVDSTCNLDRAFVRTYYVSSLCRGTGAFAMSSSLWTCKAHTSILTMTGLIISCRFACGEIHINFRTW